MEGYWASNENGRYNSYHLGGRLAGEVIWRDWSPQWHAWLWDRSASAIIWEAFFFTLSGG